MHDTLELIGPGSIAEQSRDSRLRFSNSICLRTTRLLHDATGKFPFAHRQVFGDVVEDLRTIVRRAASPATRCMGRFNRVANVLAIALTHLPNDASGRIV